MSIEVIKRSPIVGQWVEDVSEMERASLTLPYGPVHIIDIIYDETRSARVVRTSRLIVPEPYRQNGIATRLLKSGFALAKSHDVPISLSYVTSPYSLMARASTFGEAGVTIYDGDDTADPLDTSVDDAIKMLEKRTWGLGFWAESNLGDADMSDWEVPRMNQES